MKARERDTTKKTVDNIKVDLVELGWGGED
jgi:hypothetical protein